MNSARAPWVTALLTCGALAGFAGNNLLARIALAGPEPSPVAFTLLRLASGAIFLAVIVGFSRRRTGTRPEGDWGSAAALVAYAIPFSLAYVRLDAGQGALLLFGTVQFGMISWGIARGERPSPLSWLGTALACAGLVFLVRPGEGAPDLIGALLMITAGLSWSVYSVRGMAAKAAMELTAGSFLRSLPLASPLVFFLARESSLGSRGMACAIASGALASGLGYCLWNAALKGLTATRAAVLQLTVPVVAAAGGMVFLGEQVTLRFVLAASAILGGVGLALMSRVPKA